MGPSWAMETPLNGVLGIACFVRTLRATPSLSGQGWQLMKKFDPFTLAAIMRHANVRTIMRYVHPQQQEEKKRAMEA
jgi:hypothetical protein